MKKVVGLIIAFTLIIGTAVTGVWAYLSDAESTTAILAAGTLDLVPTVSGTGPAGKYTVTSGGNGVNGNVVFQKLRPGESGSITWLLVNDGSVSGTLTISSNVTFSDVTQNEVENAVPGNDTTGKGGLDQCMGIRLQRGVGTDQANAEASFLYVLGSGSSYVAFASLEAALDGESVAVGANGSSDSIVYKLSWNVASDIKKAGPDSTFGTADDIDVNENIIQGDNTEIDITFTLNQ